MSDYILQQSMDLNNLSMPYYQGYILLTDFSLEFSFQIMGWISNYIHVKQLLSHALTSMVEVRAWMRNHIPQETLDVIAYPCPNPSYYHACPVQSTDFGGVR